MYFVEKHDSIMTVILKIPNTLNQLASQKRKKPCLFHFNIVYSSSSETEADFY